MTPIAQEAIDFIVAEEVSSRQHYEKVLHRPEWPGGSSGVTVGIGYDLGYASVAAIRGDWGSHLPSGMVDAMISVSEVTGDDAERALPKVRDSIDVSWDTAMAVFEGRDVPKWDNICRSALPNYDALGPLCRGVLVSLAYNRGASFSKPGLRYAEMRDIRQAMVNKKFADIPDLLRQMRRLWTNKSNRGVAIRRAVEARLFEKGLTEMKGSS